MVFYCEVLPANLRESYVINNHNKDDDSESRFSSLRSKQKEEQETRRMRKEFKIMSETWRTGRFILSVFIFNCLLVLQVVVDTSRVVNSFRLSNWRTKRRRRLRGNEETKKPIKYYSSSSIRLSSSLASIILIALLCKLLMAPSSAQASMLVTDDSLDPQPLIYLPARETGSGMGPTSSSSSGWPSGSQQQQGISSNSPPALITAKCWNNYQTDEDCRHIQVITSDQQNSAMPTNADSSVDNNMIIGSNNNDDDSLISPVLLFESSSTLEPSHAIDGGNSQSQPAFLAPPYFSAPSSDRIPQFVEQTNRQTDAEHQPQHQKHRVFFNRHHQQPSTPPTANDLFAAPPAGATLLPPTYTVTHEPHRHQPPASVGAGFVATPRPKKPPKSTTAGRKCRDENDADCDEPEENDGAGSDGADDDEDDGADELEGSVDSDTQIGVKSGSTQTQKTADEFGSGAEPEDDNENDDDDSDLESSGAFFENPPSSSSPASSSFNAEGQFVQITSTSRSSSGAVESVSSPNAAGAEIEVVVHPTLPPSFPSSTSLSSWPVKPNEETQVSPSTAYGPIGSILPTSTSTTAMPDDTFKSKPVFPPSVPADDGASSFSQISGGFGSENQENSTVSENIDNIDLATFKPVPMPAVDLQLQQARRPIDISHSFRSPSYSSGVSSQQSSTSERMNGNSEEQNKLADRHRVDFNTPLPEVAQVATPSQQPAARPFDSPWREKSWRGQQFAGASNAEQPSWRQNKADDSVDRRLLLAQQVSPSLPQQQQPEMLPTLLLYASIIILVVTASIFIIMAFVFWRRNSIRQKALLSSKTALLNGSGVIGGFGVGAAAGMMPNQVQQQHLVGVQQPGLLSTYVPGKGFSSKLTGGLVKEDPQEIAAEDQEDEDDDEEEEEEEEEVGEEEDDEEISFSNQHPKDTVHQALHPMPNNQQQQQRTLHRPSQQSWSTDDNPTSSSAGSSQRTIDSQQAVPVPSMQQIGGRGSAIPQNARQHYASSNDNRNSSSMSDWQGSPVDPLQVPYPPRLIPPQNAPLYPPQISDNGQLYRTANQFPNPLILQQPQQMPIYPDQYYTQQPVPLHRQHIQNGFASPVIPAAVNKGFNSYHSVEELDNPHQMNYNHPPFPNLNGPPVRMSRRI